MKCQLVLQSEHWSHAKSDKPDAKDHNSTYVEHPESVNLQKPKDQ